MEKTYDIPASPCDRLLSCEKVSKEIKEKLRIARAGYEPVLLAREVEDRLSEIFAIVVKIEEERWEM